MPPGVTNLPECPVEGCDDKIDMCCAVFSGESQPCSGIYNNDPLCEILYQILELTFPPSYCCLLEGTIEIVPPTTTTTSTTSTTTTSTSTTTTSSTTTTTTLLPPATCNCYRIYNPGERAKAYTWKECEKLTVHYDVLGALDTIYICSLSDSFLPDLSLIVSPPTPCVDGCPPIDPTTTTTTTTLQPTSNYWVASNNNGASTGNAICSIVSTGGISLWSDIPTFTGAMTFYTDAGLTTPYNGQGWYHKIYYPFTATNYYAKILSNGTIAGLPDTSGSC